MGESWQQVMIEKSVKDMAPADVANLGPAPRDLSPAAQTYIKHTKPSWAWLFITIAVISTASYAFMISAIGFDSTILSGLIWPVGATALAVWSSRKAKRGRAALNAVLRDGELRFARIDEMRQTQVGKGMSKRYRYHTMFDVDGKKVMHVTMNDGMSMVNRGQQVEVVYNRDVPDEIVPTFLLV